jgi:hypothetical protein
MEKRPSISRSDTVPPGHAVLPSAPLVAPGETAAPLLISRQAVVRYVSFRSTAKGREYTMRVSDVQSSRDYVLFISHQAFADRETRFQDAPDLCSGKLRRELAAHPDLLPDAVIAVTPQDLIDYRDGHPSATDKRPRAKP